MAVISKLIPQPAITHGAQPVVWTGKPVYSYKKQVYYHIID